MINVGKGFGFRCGRDDPEKCFKFIMFLSQHTIHVIYSTVLTMKAFVFTSSCHVDRERNMV